MKKTFVFLMALTMLTVVLVQAGQAQLINYNRRGKKPVAAQAARPSSSSYSAPAAVKAAPSKAQWMIKAPKVANRYERLYDTDRNDMLDEAETKELLADVVSDVNRRGQVRISSDILKEYDINNDGKISTYEVSRIAFDLRQ